MNKESPFNWQQERFFSDVESSEEDAAEFANLFAKAPLAKQMRPGQMLSGTIVEVGKDFAIIDAGLKSEALVPVSEFANGEELEIGTKTEVCFTKRESFNGQIVLSREQAYRERRWESLVNDYGEGAVVEGKITQRMKGGAIVDIGVNAFLPISQVEDRKVKSMRDYMGKTFKFKIARINPEKRSILLSRRQLLEEDRLSRRGEIFESLEVGQVVKGKVRNIADFGAFVDVQGVDGLLHVKDISWKRIAHPSEMVKEGEEIEVMILDIDTTQNRLALGLKQCTPSPWGEIERTYPPGTRLRCTVTNIVSYGLFIEIEPGIEGLVHISELSWLRSAPNPSEVAKKGDIVEAIVLSVRKDEGRISLGIKQAQDNPWEGLSSAYPLGSRVNVEIVELRNYGALARLENELEGLIHISDISWNKKISHPSEMLQIGQRCTATILAIDEQQQKISLGLKQLTSNPWDKLEQLFPLGSIVEGEISGITPFGAFVALEQDIEGLVHITEIPTKGLESIEQALTIKQKVRTKVLRIDKENRRVALSLKGIANE